MGKCISLLDNVVNLQEIVSYKWVKKHDPEDGYSVKGVYHLLTRVDHHNHDHVSKIIWNRVVPLKVSLFASRLLNRRISTKDNLVYCIPNNLDSLLYLGGSRNEDTINHLFMDFFFFLSFETFGFSFETFGLMFCVIWEFKVSDRKSVV